MMNMMNKGIVLLLVAFMACALLVAAPGSAETPGIVKIGVMLPFSGSKAEYSNEVRRGIEIATDIMREKGGLKIGGKPYDVQILWCDTPDVQSGVAECERLITKEKVNIVSGTFVSDIPIAATTIAEKYKTIYWETSAVSDDITNRGLKYTFRTSSTGSLEGRQLVQFSYENAILMGKDDAKGLSFVLCGIDSSYGTSVLDGAEKRIKELGCKLAFREQYSAGVTDLTSLLLKIKVANPDVVVLAASVDDGMLFYRQMKEQAVYVKCLIGTGSSSGAELFHQKFGKDAEFVCSGNHPSEFSPPGYAPGLADFMARYRKKYNREHIFSIHCLQGFHGYTVLYDVLNRSKSLNSDDIRAAALATDIPVNTIANGWGCKFAPPGDPMMGTNLRAYPVVTQWQDGKLYMVWPMPYPGRKVVLPMPTWEERAKG